MALIGINWTDVLDELIAKTSRLYLHNDRFWPIADLADLADDVRCSSESGHPVIPSPRRLLTQNRHDPNNYFAIS